MSRKRARTFRSHLTRVIITVFMTATLLTFTLGVFATHRSLKQTDREEITSKTAELTAAYRRGGLPALRETVERDNALGRDRPYFIRLADEQNNTLLSSVPKEWQRFDFSRLNHRSFSHRSAQQERKFMVLKNTGMNYGVEIFSRRLEGGYLLQVGGSTKNRAHVVQALIRTFALITIPAVLLLLGFLWWFSKVLMRPVTDLVGAARRVIDRGHYDSSLPERNIAREFDDMAEQFNRMFATLDGLMANMRKTLTTIAHEVRTPMTRLHMKAESALQEEASPDQRFAALQSCIEESETVISLLKKLMEASEAESGMLSVQPGQCDLAHLCSDMAELYEDISLEQEISVRYQGPASCPGQADAARIKQLLSNLLDNALKYTPEGSTVSIRLHTEAEESNENTREMVLISVLDEGPGIKHEDLSHIWDYGFRSFSSVSAKGHGLGLPLVKTIAEAHGGKVNARNLQPAGSEFTVRLPRNGW